MKKNNMKKVLLIALVLNIMMLFPGVNSLFAQQDVKFEGTAELTLKGKKSDSDVKYYAKGNMARVEMGENAGKETSVALPGTIIFKNDEMFILMPSRKAYVEKPLNITNKLNELSRKEDLESKVSRTGQQKDIIGHKADQWIIKTNSGEIELWNTRDLGNILFFENTGAGSYPKWFQELTSGGFFPLLVIQRDLNGNEVNRLEVKNVKKEPVESKYFEIPQDYKRTEGGQKTGRTRK